MKLYYENTNVSLYQGDMLEVLDTFEENSIDCIVTDPPYELNFMNKGWDNTGIVFNVETWKKCLRVLKPGGYLLCFGASRMFHRVFCAIEDAGFEIRDTIMWLYGSGFPKSMNIGLAIDKKNGVESPVVGQNPDILKKQAKDLREGHRVIADSFDAGAPERNNGFKTVSADIKQAQNDWKGWGTALKPAYEPIMVARKPFEGSLIDNVLNNGVGGINIDECRVELEDGYEFKQTTRHSRTNNVFTDDSCGFKAETNTVASANPMGRFPANVILTYDTVDEEEVCGGFPNSGSGNGGQVYSYAGREYDNKDTSMFNGDKPQAPSNYNDTGSASRYFKNCEYTDDDIKDVDVVSSLQPNGRFPANVILTYDDTDEEEVCGGFPNSKGANSQNNYSNKSIYRGQSLNESSTKLEGYREWYNDDGSASRYFKNCEYDDNDLEDARRYYYCPKASKKDRNEGILGKRNMHPTVKPSTLLRYLIRLVAPKNAIILDPFNGSGSTGKACMLENRERSTNYKYIGIDLSEEYLNISRARIEWAMDTEITSISNNPDDDWEEVGETPKVIKKNKLW